MTLYQPRHEWQYAYSTRTRQSGCTWTSGAVGADAATGGKVDPSPDAVLAKVQRSEESNPITPGWSLQDLDLAMKRLGVGFDIASGLGWAGVKAAHDDGHYIVLQGDSDQFSNNTCSGAFDGDHAVGIRPGNDARGYWPLDDPICRSMRYESPDVLRRYAVKFSPMVRFGIFTTKVPVLPPDTSTEAAMKLTNAKALTGTATMTATWGLWRVRDDVKSANVAKGTKFDVLGSCTYHEQYTGYLVNHAGELHVLPSKDVSVYTAKPADPVPYPVKLSLTVGGKPVSVTTGPLTLP